MKEYDVEVTQKLQQTITVKADSQEEAQKLVEDAWYKEDHVLDPDYYAGVDFKAIGEHKPVRSGTIEVLLVEPGMYPEQISIKNELGDLQASVGGNIETMYPYDDSVALVVNDEGKIMGLPLNRALRDEDGEIADIIAGAFLVVGLKRENFASLSPQLMEKYEKLFHQPEVFVRIGGDIEAIPLPDRTVKKAKRSFDHSKKPHEPER